MLLYQQQQQQQRMTAVPSPVVAAVPGGIIMDASTTSASSVAGNTLPALAPLSPSMAHMQSTALVNGTAQFYSAPPAIQTHSTSSTSLYAAAQHSPSSPPPTQQKQSSQSPTAGQSPSRPSQNDILRRIVKADDEGIKKRNKQHQFKGLKGTIVPPPPLSKYKRPPPIIPNRPGERYPLGMP